MGSIGFSMCNLRVSKGMVGSISRIWHCRSSMFNSLIIFIGLKGAFLGVLGGSR